MSDLIADIEEYFSIGRGHSVSEDLLERALTTLKEQESEIASLRQSCASLRQALEKYGQALKAYEVLYGFD